METRELKRQIEELKEQVEQAQQQPTSNVGTQLELMEKSYQMAAKYLPANSGNSETESKKALHPEPIAGTAENDFTSISIARENVVSILPRELKDDASQTINEGLKIQTFLTPTDGIDGEKAKNSVRAVIQETQVVTGEGFVKLRLVEAAKMKGQVFPVGTRLTATAKIQNNRVLLQVTSVEFRGNIFSVSIKIHDLDGQLGLPVPYSTERSALTEMAANMSQQSGSSLMLTQSAGQQIAGDVTRGVVQGVSRYFAKKVRAPKVTLKAGHQVFLVSEK